MYCSGRACWWWEGQCLCWVPRVCLDFPGFSRGKESTWDAGDSGLFPGSERSSGEGNGYPLQYSCLENPIDRGAWWATVHGIAKSQAVTEWLTLSHTFHEESLYSAQFCCESKTALKQKVCLKKLSGKKRHVLAKTFPIYDSDL